MIYERDLALLQGSIKEVCFNSSCILSGAFENEIALLFERRYCCFRAPEESVDYQLGYYFDSEILQLHNSQKQRTILQNHYDLTQ